MISLYLLVGLAVLIQRVECRLSQVKGKDVKFQIPYSMQVHDSTVSNFEPVSSHGREDHASDSLPTLSKIVFASRVLVRAMYLLMVFLPVILSIPLALFWSYFRVKIFYWLIYCGIERSGAALTKWGQWASTRPDVFPMELCSYLAKLQSSAPLHSFSHTKSSIELEFKENFDSIFDSFDKKALGCGSIAQVHAASLNGEVVAVKVRHPNVDRQIRMDFSIMKTLAYFIDNIPGLTWLKLRESMAQFSETIASQVRLDIEGKHLFLFNRFFKKWSCDTAFPKPLALTESVLIESFERGESVAKFANMVANARDKQVKLSSADLDLAHFIVCRGEDIYLKMLLQDNLMHADLHPGNILIQQETKSSVNGSKIINGLSIGGSNEVNNKIVIVDAGMVAKLLPEERSNFIGLLEAMGEGIGEEAAECVMKFSEKGYSSYSEATKALFKQEMKELFSHTCRGYHTNVSIGDVLRQVLNLVRKYQITIEANYATLIMNSLCLDSMAQSLMPSYNILDGGKSLLRAHRIGRKLHVSTLMNKVGLPLGMAMKRREDKKFLKRLKKDYFKQQ